jgi:hypothetical protein
MSRSARLSSSNAPIREAHFLSNLLVFELSLGIPLSNKDLLKDF